MDIYIPARFFRRPESGYLMNIVTAQGRFSEQIEVGKTYRIIRDDGKGGGFTAVVVGKQSFNSRRDLEVGWPNLKLVSSLSRDYYEGAICLIQVRESTPG